MWIGIYKPYSGGPISTTVYVGDTSNANMTLGLTINQGAADNEILALKSSDVAHTLTTDTEADTYVLIKKYSATAGGALLRGLTDSDVEGGLVLEGIIGSTNPTDTNAALLLIGSKQTGTTTAALGAAETVLKIYNRTTSLITLMGDGDLNIGTRISLHGGTNDDGLVFGNLGTATKAIDLSGSGLSGATDYWFYGSSSAYWDAVGQLYAVNLNASAHVSSSDFYPITSGEDLILMHSGQSSNIISHILASTNSHFLVGTKTHVGDFTSVTFPTANKDYANATGIGTGVSAVGELLQVVSGTGATTGIYRIKTLISANSVQVDRNIHAEAADITDGVCKIYKNIMSISPTDATNGQMFTSWSAQNKPMQLGGTVLAATANSLTSTDVVMGGMTEFMGNTFFKAGTSAGYSTPVGAINVTTTAVGNVTTGEDTLMTYSLPLNALSANAKGVRVTVYGTIANNANAKTIKVYFGTTAVYTDSMTINQAYNWYAQYTAVRTGTDTQDVFGSGFFENTTCTVAPYYATDTQDDGAAIAIKCTGEGVGSDDIIQQGMLVEYIN